VSKKQLRKDKRLTKKKKKASWRQASLLVTMKLNPPSTVMWFLALILKYLAVVGGKVTS
jgi:hypothetical protein